jgi:4-hydroxybenzoate polyprenyltransferase
MPLFFAAKFGDPVLQARAATAFVAFCLTASAVYIFNDCQDIEEDRRHPTKKNRPLSSGEVDLKTARSLMLVSALVGLLSLSVVSLPATAVLGVYVVINIAYTLRLKHIAIIDVMIIASGFVLRLFVGALATGIALSQWIVMMTFLLALFLALAKRRDDVLIFLDTGEKMRRTVEGYNLQFLDTTMAIMAAVVIVAYSIWAASDQVVAKFHARYLYLTSFFVILGILRYLQIVFVHLDSGSPTKIILQDRFLQLTLLGWIVAFAWILY